MRGSWFRIVLMVAAAVAIIAAPTLAQEVKGGSNPPGPGIPGGATGGPDMFGYTFFDQDEPECTTNFFDISGTGTVVVYTASGGFPAEDDGGAVINLSSPFVFYGDVINDVVISSNGYIGMGASTLAMESGGDFSNDCPIPAIPGTAPFVSSRVMPYHDDLAGDGTGGTTYHQFFASCPRPGESGGDEACTIFQWTNWGFFGGAVGFNMQVILYHTSYEIAFEIDDPNGVADGGSATLGIQNATATDALMYQCNVATIGAVATVCNFHPNFPPGSLVGGELPVPTMSAMGMILLASLLALGGLFFMMRRRTA